MKRYVLMAAVTLIAAAAACSSRTTGKGQCSANDQCAAGDVCEAGACIKICATQSDCPTGQVCTSNRTCAAPASGPVPSIATIAGNDPTDNQKIQDGLLVTGTALTNAVFELRAATGSTPLDVRSETDTAAELVLPADIRSGTYALVATNSAGSAQQTVTLQLPELTGKMLVDRINGDSSAGTLDVSHLPVGTTAGTVAAGDRNYDNRYYTQAYLDANFLHQTDTPQGRTQGSNYVPNTAFTEGTDGFAGWDIQTGGTSPTYSRAEVDADGDSSIYALQNGPTTLVDATSTRRIPVDQGIAYRVTGAFRALAGGGGSGTLSLGVRFYDASGTTELIPSASDWWPFSVVGDVGLTVPSGQTASAWQRDSFVFGAGTTYPAPANARFMSVSIELNADHTSSPPIAGNRNYQVQGLGIYDMTSPWTQSAPDTLSYPNNVNIGGSLTVTSGFNFYGSHANGSRAVSIDELIGHLQCKMLSMTTGRGGANWDRGYFLADAGSYTDCNARCAAQSQTCIGSVDMRYGEVYSSGFPTAVSTSCTLTGGQNPQWIYCCCSG